VHFDKTFLKRIGDEVENRKTDQHQQGGYNSLVNLSLGRLTAISAELPGSLSTQVALENCSTRKTALLLQQSQT
jgi:hypothetical protein